jgi:hypothetical protein
MPSPYQEFARQARERFLAKQKQAKEGGPETLQSGGYHFTTHAQYKMRQYGLSVQKVRGVIRSPKRKEIGIAPKTVAVMQPVSPKIIAGKETWKQEIWVMFQEQDLPRAKLSGWSAALLPGGRIPQAKSIKIISAWRYPGVSPKRHPIPAEILREIEEGCILEGDENEDFSSL